MIVYAEFRVEADNLRLQQPVELETMRRALQSALQELPAMVGANVRVRIAEREYTSPPEFSAPEISAIPRDAGGSKQAAALQAGAAPTPWRGAEKVADEAARSG